MLHEVILRFDEGDPRLRIYDIWGVTFRAGGHTFLRLSCDTLLPDGSCWQARLSAPGEFAGLTLLIPQNLLVVAFSGETARSIGFHEA